ncbi:hypothetical protein [Zeaxanthinibacter enoshimensis]|nr:hypothetical protein [Zeaxanthinibacter enoshimensis]
MKRILGILFLLVSLFLLLAFIGQFSIFLSDLTNFLGISDSTGSYDTGYLLGRLFYWLIHLSAMTLFLIFGIRIIDRRKKKLQNPEI